MWLGLGPSVPSGDMLAATLDGSPVDAAAYGVLFLAGATALVWRGRKTGAILKASIPINIYFAYCLLSTLWSPFPESSFKRWVKCVGDLIMVLVILTDAQPTAALRRVFSRVALVMFPLSIVFIKFTNFGVVYDEQGPHYIGVTTNKNALGVMIYIFTIGVLWNICSILFNRQAPYRARRLVAQTILFASGIVLLQMAHSATSIFCFVLGGGLMLATGFPIIKRRPKTLHILCLGIVVFGAASVFFGGTGAVTSVLGRKSDLSGRTEIWAAAIASEDSQWFGTGFESFWNKNNPKVVSILQSQGFADILNLNSAHNGYLQIYLDLGLLGLFLLSLVLVGGYLKVVKAFRMNRELGSLFLAYLITCAFHAITESDFRIMTLTWNCVLLSVLGAAGVIVGEVRAKGRRGRVVRARSAIGTIAIQSPVSTAGLIRMGAHQTGAADIMYTLATSAMKLSVSYFS